MNHFLQFPKMEHSMYVVDTPAKLNLFLELTGKRPNGYHELVSFMVPVGWYDTLEFQSTDDGTISLEIEGGTADISAGTENLVVRALKILREKSGCTSGAAVRLTKRIPSQAGLGGGSSDAAATLLAANRLWKLGFSPDELAAMATSLGCDVPFFLFSKPAICRGCGEIVEPSNLPVAAMNELLSYFFVIVKPPFGLSTAEVYRHCQVPEDSQRRQMRFPSDDDSGKGWMFNRLQESALAISLPLRKIYEQLRRLTDCHVQMTGSGSAFFICCVDRLYAETLATTVRHSLGDGVLVIVVTVDV